MTELTKEQRGSLKNLAESARDHFDMIEQDVPDSSFLVGGAVRDSLIGLDPQDMDWVVVGETMDSMEERGFEKIEATSFPVFHDSEHQEWALARDERKDGYGYHEFEIETEGVGLKDDLERRDITINSMCMRIEK